MTGIPTLIAFDLDDTLAPLKTRLHPSISNHLTALLARTNVCIITGSTWDALTTQVLPTLTGATEEHLERLHLMPVFGNHYYRRQNTEWVPVYLNNLTEDEITRARGALVGAAMSLGLWEAAPVGNIIIEHGAHVTFAGPGEDASTETKLGWDPTGGKREALRDAVQFMIPDLDVRVSSTTAVDVTQRGADKGYGMTRLSELTGIPLDEMLFVGDQLYENGNDYPVQVLGVDCVAVKNWHDTVVFLDAFTA